jgi:hypothetical protein
VQPKTPPSETVAEKNMENKNRKPILFITLVYFITVVPKTHSMVL